MERDIKFRGKRIDSGEWVYGDLIQLDNQSYIAGVHQWAGVSSNNSIEIDVTKIVSETVGQFTGLKDKNGIEIYEGDLLRYPPESKWDEDNYSCFEVFFHNGNANSDYNIGYSISRMHNYGVVCGGYIPSFKPKTVTKMIVIGNIHDNL